VRSFARAGVIVMAVRFVLCFSEQTA